MYLSLVLFFVILRRPPRTKRTNTLFPCTTLVRSLQTEFAELRRLADERATRLHSANDIVALASRQVRPWIRQLAALASRKEQRHLRRLSEALTRWNKRSEEHTSELQSLMRISYAVFCLKKNSREHTYKHQPQ